MKQIVKAVPLPVIAIGGIGEDNAAPVIRAGAHGFAVISAVCCQPDPREAAECLRRLWEEKAHV
jgi:thiamine-phosphate pyrophosphorylase